MPTRALGLFFALSFMFPAVHTAGAEEFHVPPASVASEELNGVRDRLLTVLFFRGELADRIIEAGLQDKLVNTAGLQTHSEVRLALLNWIYGHPDEAAKLYFYIRDRKPGEKMPSGPVNYTVSSWNLTKGFLELAGRAERAAADASMGDEEMSLIAQRLFEAAQAPPEEYAPLIPGGARDAGSGDGGPSVKYADYKLNAERVERERQALDKWFESLKARWEAALALEAPGESPDPVRVRRLLEETFLLYRNFVVYLSNLKGLKRINGSDAGRLETLRRDFRRNLSELEALSAKRRLAKQMAGLPDGVPGAAVLRSDALTLEKAFDAFLAELWSDPESVKNAGRKLYELENAGDLWAFRVLMHRRLLKMKDGIAGRGYSCVWDKLVFGYLSRYFPSSGYAAGAAALSSRAGTLDAALEGVASGEGAAAFLAGGGKPLLELVGGAEDGLARLRNYSRLNRIAQFIFWDALLNPLGLHPAGRVIGAGVRL